MNDKIKRRYPFLAAFLSLLMPGLGQLYNGQWKAAVFFGFLFVFLILVVIFTPVLKTFEGMAFCFSLGVGFYIASFIWAWIKAFQVKEITIKPYNNIFSYFLFFIFFIALSVPLKKISEDKKMYPSFSVPNASMISSVMQGDFFIADKNYTTPQRGDIAVFKLPSNQDIIYFKRVIGLSGDKIQYISGRLYLNDEVVHREVVGTLKTSCGTKEMDHTEYLESYPDGTTFSIYEQNDDRPQDQTSAFLVPENHFFVLGDNRDCSQDSRVQDVVGFVPYENLVGKAIYIYWSKDFKRIGKKIN